MAKKKTEGILKKEGNLKIINFEDFNPLIREFNSCQSERERLAEERDKADAELRKAKQEMMNHFDYLIENSYSLYDQRRKEIPVFDKSNAIEAKIEEMSQKIIITNDDLKSFLEDDTAYTWEIVLGTSWERHVYGVEKRTCEIWLYAFREDDKHFGIHTNKNHIAGYSDDNFTESESCIRLISSKSYFGEYEEKYKQELAQTNWTKAYLCEKLEREKGYSGNYRKGSLEYLKQKDYLYRLLDKNIRKQNQKNPDEQE